MDDAHGDRQDPWSFGQILPVILLVAPIWSLICAFAFSDHGERPPYSNQFRDNFLTPASAAVDDQTTYYTAPRIDDSITVRENRFHAEATCLMSGHVPSCWMGPCLTFPCLVIIAITAMEFFMVVVGLYTQMDFWVTRWGEVYILFLVYPFALQFTIVLGLVYEEGFLEDRTTPSRSKARLALLWVTAFVIWAFFIALWTFFLSDFGPYLILLKRPGWDVGGLHALFGFRYWVTIAGTAVLHLVYASWYFWQAFRKRSKLG